MNKKQLVVIMKNPGTSCNIGCIYCAEERKKYISIDNVISFEQAQQLAELTKDYSLNVLFHGGEPTLLDCNYYEQMMQIFKSVNDDVFFGIQTNATRLNDEWFSFLKNNKKELGISVSLDGPKEVNKFRLSKSKEETYDLVCDNVRKLSENNIKTGMICTVVSTAIGKERELYDMLVGFDNLQFVKLNPCMDRNKDGSVPLWGVTPKQYFKFVCNFFDILVKESAWDKFLVEPIISVVKNLQGVKSPFCNYTYDKCFNFISLYPDGTITSCDNYNLQHGMLGNLKDVENIDSIVRMQNNSCLLDSYTKMLKQCELCEVKEMCKGGCIASRERYHDTNEYCDGMKMMINHIKGVYETLNENT